MAVVFWGIVSGDGSSFRNRLGQLNGLALPAIGIEE